MVWNLNADRPIYSQLVEIMQMRIITGFYKPGDRLPSVRDLATEAGVNPNTMQKALAELERSSLVITQRTSGRTVTENMELIRETQRQLADEHIRHFFQSMRELGFSREEILALIEKSTQEEEIVWKL